ncbi:class I SAM-dependent methyltransferase [Nocardioides litoris]|uniref:class I SAM-dependent methyltransferase n=1 Tax=Nocardioides litoris TaxID=1926648 RepID=UPI00112119F4|nr:class I SAM-dependent methyltransferase [Nocardioides litoris]
MGDQTDARPPARPPARIEDTPGRYCPCCDRHVRGGLKPGPDGRPDATCPHCRSLERHRFFAVLLGALRPALGRVGTLLDVAPAPQPRAQLLRLEPRRYVRCDLRPGRGVDVRGDLTSLPFRDGCVDLLVCYHVLEHVVDDRTAIRELARVLAPGGLGIVQVPWRPGTVTDEDPDAPEEERVRRFGLADHVRYYGDDVEDRLVEGGLDVHRVTPLDLVGPAANTFLGLGQDQSVWLVRPATDGPTPPWALPSSGGLGDTLEAMVTEIAALRRDRREARQALRREQDARSGPAAP